MFRKDDGSFSLKKIGIVGFLFFGLIIVGISSKSLVEKNDYGFYQITQSLDGEMDIMNDTGFYYQGFATITTYKVGDVLYFSKHNIDGGDNDHTVPVTVTFNGNSKAEISGVLKYKLSKQKEKQFLIHEDYGSANALRSELLRQYVTEVLIQTAPLMTAEEAYAPRKTEFKKIAEEQLIRGIFKKKTRIVETEEKTLGSDGEEKIQQKTNRVVELVLDKDGNPVIDTESPLRKYGIEVVNFTLKDFDFDPKTEELIAKKKESEMQKVLAETDAQRAQQETVKLIAEGKAKFADAEAKANVEKVTATINAEKEKQVAELSAQKVKNVAELKAQQEFNVGKLTAEKELTVAKLEKEAAAENAKAKLLVGEAEAKVAKLKVDAGLTPLERAEIEKDRAIGIANALSKFGANVTTVIGGGDGGTDSVGGIAKVVGLNQLMGLTEKLSNSKAAPEKK